MSRPFLISPPTRTFTQQKISSSEGNIVVLSFLQGIKKSSLTN